MRNVDTSSEIPSERTIRIAQVVDEVVDRRGRGEPIADEQVIAAHPEMMPELGERLADLRVVDAGYADAALDATAPSSGAAPVFAGEPAADALVGRRIGRYDVQRLVATGGMGAVYEAVQQSPRRCVALKLMKPGLASHALWRRFEHEAEMLGRLRHPGIAQIYEAGVHDERGARAPYFAMEFVGGAQRITDYARVRGLGTRQRLDLLASVCDAVQHAHQQGVIHRDLKPSNVLVDAAGCPKVVDFGVARTVDAEIQVTTLQTDVGQVIGTVPYMSPEQIAGVSSEIDTRCDVYALGVLAYELLTGRLPYDLRGCLVPEAMRIIRDQDPTALSSLDRALRGDVETIVHKALEKDKARRYQSAAELGADLRRYLGEQAIVARPPNAWYQFSKFARRNRGLVAGGALAFVGLAVGASFATWKAVEATAQRNRAQTAEMDARLEAQRAESERARAESERQRAQEAELAARTQARTAEQVSDFLRNLLLTIDPGIAEGRDVSVLIELLETAAERIDSELRDAPLERARLLHTIGSTFGALGDYERSERRLREAVEVFRRAAGPDDLRTAEAMQTLAITLRNRGRAREAIELYKDVVRIRKAHLGDTHEDTLRAMTSYAVALQAVGEIEAAEALLLEACDRAEATLGPDHSATLLAAKMIAALREQQGRFQEAETLLRDVLERYLRARGEKDVGSIGAMHELSRLLGRMGKEDEALELARRGLELRIAVFGPDHPRTAAAMYNLGMMLRPRGKYDEAERLYRAALEIRKQRLGPEHEATLSILTSLANLRRYRGDLAGAEQMMRDTLDGWVRRHGPDHARTLRAMELLAGILRERGELEEAEQTLRTTVERRIATAPDHPDTADSKIDLASVLLQRGAYVEAERLAREGRLGLAEGYGPTHGRTLEALSLWGQALSGLGRWDDARAPLGELVEQLRVAGGLSGADARRAAIHLATAYASNGQPEQAEAVLIEALDAARSAQANPGDVADLESRLGACLGAQGRWDEALPLLAQARKTLAGAATPDERYVQATERLATAYEALGRDEQADALRAECERLASESARAP